VASARDPWLLRVSRLSPLVPAAVGATVIAVGLAISVAIAGDRLRLPMFFITAIALFIAGVPYAVRGAASSLDRLTAFPEAKRESMRRRLASLSPLAWALGFATGVSIHLFVLSLVDRGSEAATGLAYLATWEGLVIVLGWLHILLVSPSMSLLVMHGLIFMRLGRDLPSVDLLDRAPVAPFAEMSLRLSLLSTVFFGMTVVFHLDWSGDLGLARQVVFVSPVWLSIGIALFVFPLWGVHVRLRDARRAELQRVQRALGGDRAALRESLLTPGEAESFGTSDLLRYRGEVTQLGTWPFGTNELARLGLYLAIPVFGWLGGALMERAVDATLSR
jgi:hypothetical protein